MQEALKKVKDPITGHVIWISEMIMVCFTNIFLQCECVVASPGRVLFSKNIRERDAIYKEGVKDRYFAKSEEEHGVFFFFFYILKV